jgi:cobalt-zinc-cadmium efflux system protein
MAHEHGHGGDTRARLIGALVVISVFFVIELVAGFATRSLALLSDAGHMATDVLALSMAAAAATISRRDDHDAHHTYGLARVEVVAAFVNAILLFGVAIWVVVEAARRLATPHEPLSGPMFWVALGGLAANLVAFALLRDGADSSINHEGAYLEVLADTVGSIGVIVAAVLAHTFGWAWADPVVGALIGLWILPRTWILGRKAVRILLESAPSDVDLASVARDLASIDGVTDAHDLHVWSLSSGKAAATAHLRVAAASSVERVRVAADDVLTRRHRIAHVTVQIEPSGSPCRTGLTTCGA